MEFRPLIHLNLNSLERAMYFECHGEESPYTGVRKTSMQSFHVISMIQHRITSQLPACADMTEWRKQ